MFLKNFKFGNKKIGRDSKTFFIADGVPESAASTVHLFLNNS